MLERKADYMRFFGRSESSDYFGVLYKRNCGVLERSPRPDLAFHIAGQREKNYLTFYIPSEQEWEEHIEGVLPDSVIEKIEEFWVYDLLQK